MLMPVLFQPTAPAITQAAIALPQGQRTVTPRVGVWFVTDDGFSVGHAAIFTDTHERPQPAAVAELRSAAGHVAKVCSPSETPMAAVESVAM